MADYWIKLYIEMLDDPKIGTLPDGLCWRFVQCCLMAGRHNLKGAIPDTRQLAWAFRLDTNDLEHEMQQLASIGLVEKIVNGWMVKNFEKRQAATSPAERMKYMRERQHKEQYSNDDVTSSLQNVTQINRNRLTETETETETEKNAPPSIFAKLSALIATKLQINEYTGGADRWTSSIRQIQDSGAIEEDIDRAIKWMDDNKHSIAGPWSIVNPVVIAVGQKKRGNGNGSKPLTGRALLAKMIEEAGIETE